MLIFRKLLKDLASECKDKKTGYAVAHMPLGDFQQCGGFLY